METKQETRRNDVIRCEYCGEDYSVTYRHCPFCDDKASYGCERAPARGGKRVATNKRGGGYGRGMDPVQVIGVILSIILIIAAVYIVISILSPLFQRDDSPVSSTSTSVSQSQPDVSTAPPAGSSTGDVSTPVIPDVPETPGVITPIVTATGITLTINNLSAKDVTLKPDEVARVVATLAPAGCTDTVIWSSSNDSVLSVTQDGTVTNVNRGTTQVTVTLTAQVGDVKAVCLMRCKPGSTATAPSTSTTPSTGTSTGTSAGASTPVKSGTKGTVFGTTTGLRIRSGPGTSYAEQDTALNGAELTILEQTADGWYKVNYSGSNGKTKTGYVSKDYVKVN